MTENPLVTIIVPSHNRANFIGDAIQGALDQTFRDWELLVIDDASTDDTESVVRDFMKQDPRILYVKNPVNMGISKTRNIGLAKACGTYIAMLDSDDVWLDPKKLSEQIAAFEKKPRLGMVGTWITRIDEAGKKMDNVRFAESDADIRRSFLYKNHIAQSSVLFLKNAAAEAGGYDEKLATMEDHDLWLNIGTHYQVMTLPIYATGYRVHRTSITKNRRVRVALDELSVIRRWKKNYPGAVHGLIKGYARLLLAYF